MNETELYEKQYGENKIINAVSFPFLRKVCKQFDIGREDIALKFMNKGKRLLDVGCGNGSLMFKADKRFDEIYGIDISPSRIDEAQETASQRFGSINKFNFSVCNTNNGIGFTDNSFDAVVSIAVIEHIFDIYHTINEIYRVLKPKGIFVIEVPNIAYIRNRLHLLFGKLPVTSSPYNWQEIGWDGGHLHYFTKKTLCKLLRECGFKIMKVSGSGLFANFRNFYPSLLTGDIFIKAVKQ